jgi:hypothetical protein
VPEAESGYSVTMSRYAPFLLGANPTSIARSALAARFPMIVVTV